MISNFKQSHKFLSNFYSCKIQYEGIEYASVEHAYQAAKFHDSIIRNKIASCPTPGKSKRLARDNSQLIRDDWDKIKVGVMEELLRIKFNKPHLKQLLLNTGSEILQEGNWWHDNFWGNCLCSDKIKCQFPGLNKLGELLMKIRMELQ